MEKERKRKRNADWRKGKSLLVSIVDWMRVGNNHNNHNNNDNHSFLLRLHRNSFSSFSICFSALFALRSVRSEGPADSIDNDDDVVRKLHNFSVVG